MGRRDKLFEVLCEMRNRLDKIDETLVGLRYVLKDMQEERGKLEKRVARLESNGKSREA